MVDGDLIFWFDITGEFERTSASNRLWPLRRSAAVLGLVFREEEAVASIAHEVARMLDHLDGGGGVGDLISLERLEGVGGV